MEITAAIVLFFVLVILVVALKKRKIDSNTLQDWANLVTVSSVISAIIVGLIIGFLYLIKPAQTALPQSVATPTVEQPTSSAVTEAIRSTELGYITLTATLQHVTETVTPSNTPISTNTPTYTAAPTITPTYVPTTAPTSTPTPVIILNRNSTMVLIPDGFFEINGESGVAQIHVNGFYIDQHEVTNGEYRKCVEANSCSPPITDTNNQSKNVVHYGNLAYDNYPIILVSWNKAQNYCKWRGTATRLPTDIEWEKAARASLKGKPYPWGDSAPICSAGAVNGTNFLDCGTKDAVPVMSYVPNGYGVYDMAGNVSEWVDNITSDATKMFRGGSWADNASQITVFSSAKRNIQSGVGYPNIGFRCASSQ